MINIDNFIINDDSECYIIAEISANHCNSFEIAKKTIIAAKESGANAVKIQTYTADTMTIDCKSDLFRISGGTIWDGQYEYDIYKEGTMPWEWQPKLKEIADEIGITLFSTPFDKTAVDFLEKMNVPVYKVASFEAVDIPLIKYIASKNKPIIISTGIIEKDEIFDIVDACNEVNNDNLILLKCISSYPAPLEEMNLKTLIDMKTTFNTIVGLSDHTMDLECVLAAVALGAKVVEKHFTLDRTLGGPDALFSMEPNNFKEMVDSIRKVEKALGNISYNLSEKSKLNRNYSRSLFIVKDMVKGDIFSDSNLKSIRPGYGISPKEYENILGKKCSQNIKRGTPMSYDYINC
ncbi:MULTISPECIES: pseudaminic acid synthase [unclassified Oceanispirochaeta]|uniref:pseudaminic acid synthase n=1 Tax=unclassified Oceanispirochaeta TaxID=2635722 RepID=UPI000E08FD31|nr:MULTISPECIES: pseudaminic acid synthase [unclassified Oceanispirochaeta]MBF9018675.1 pseudaminic acid synthase [Oceanispirochaeta sp. M2]NPD75113.1 pseudaminic acid synthase [Oceanispirochaeta sp. M1]RDG29037.1 pseudaminic acid synthase [Oceanispirochaeta sp. M1]